MNVSVRTSNFLQAMKKLDASIKDIRYSIILDLLPLTPQVLVESFVEVRQPPILERFVH
jgi:hypothetical protein